MESDEDLREGPSEDPEEDILVVEAVWPYYQRARRSRGVPDGEQYRPPTGTDPGSRYARWNPAEEALLAWYEDVKDRLVSPVTRLPFSSARSLVLALHGAFRFRRSAAQFGKKRRRPKKK